MPLYPANSLRGLRFQGLGQARSSQIYRSASSEATDDDDDSEGGLDYFRSVTSPIDDLYDSDLARSNFSEDYTDYLQDDLVHQVEVSSAASSQADSPVGPLSPQSSRAHLAERLHDLGIDSETSDPPDFLGDETPGDTDDDSHDSDSDGDLSNGNSAEEMEEDYVEVPNPPELPVVAEERLQEVWPLGDQSFSIFLCPITHDVMTDPVVSADGYTYERLAIARWFETSRKSPVTGQTLPHTDLVPNHSVRTLLKTLIDMTVGTEPKPPVPPEARGSGRQPCALEQAEQRETEQQHKHQQQPQLQQQRPQHDSRGPPDFQSPSFDAASSDFQRPSYDSAAADQWRDQASADRVRWTPSLSPVGRLQLVAPRGAAGGSSSMSSSVAGPGAQRPPGPAASPRGSAAMAAAQDSRLQQRSPPLVCPQARPQAPSTALPPLRTGLASMVREPNAPRGQSPPLVAPPLSYRGGPPARLPSQPPPFPPPSGPPLEGAASHGSGSRGDGASPSSLGPPVRGLLPHKRPGSLAASDSL